MLRSAIGMAAMGILSVGLICEPVRAVQPVDTIEWVGGASGEWNNANAWQNVRTGVTGNATTLMGSNRGSEGMNNIDPALTAARHIVIGGGATVDYNNIISASGMRLRQGTTLTIKDGATWVQDMSDHPANTSFAECRCDPSELILDGGTFRRIGEATGDPGDGGGGNAIFGSYNDDNNGPFLGTLPPRANVVIKNGGRLENTGQLWFGTDGESSPNTRVHFTINNGHMDLTGGGIPIENGEMTGLGGVVGDLAFFYDYSEHLTLADPVRAHDEEFFINFTGPGSIKVDSTGIRVLRQPAPEDPSPEPPTAVIPADWTGRDTQVSYQDLWNMGILKANGLSGKTGLAWPHDGATPRTLAPANFDNFFTVTGTPGTNDYTLTAKPATTLPTIEWVGGASGEWNDANAWRNTTTGVVGNATTLMGSNRGSEGMNNIDPALTAARHIVIGGGATVDYNNIISASGMRLRQGTTLTIKDGATWVQDMSDHPANTSFAECRCDPSELILDGGTFRRIGEATGDPGDGGGGNAIFGSYNDDNNGSFLGTLPPRANVVIKNGGRLENTGQLWFGTDGESSPNTRVHFTINNGHMDLTGGGIPIENGEMTGLGGVVGDLAFFYDYSEHLSLADPVRAHDEEYVINFTGPGSITVDSAGIRVLEQPAPEDPSPEPPTAVIPADWTGRDVQVSYQDLWNLGILQANGLSGKTGLAWPHDGATPRTLAPANFNTFFSVTGMPGMDNYILTSLIEGLPDPGLDGDFNGDGKVDAADYVVWRKNDNSQAGYDLWRTNFGRTSGSGSGLGAAGVPEPSSLLLVLAACGLAAACARRR